MMNKNCTEVGDWKKKKRLGRGSFGDVSLWTNSRNESVAIKICFTNTNQLQAHDTQKFETRWLREIEVLKTNSSEYLVQWINVPEFMTNESLKIITMEYCELGDLRLEICKFENCNGFKETEVRNILKCLGEGVKFLHKNKISHRDIKPENIVITRVDGKKIYKLTDFGYAKSLVNTNDASIVGTQFYLAPEVIITGKYSQRVDFWSLGVVIFEVICGERPFSLDNCKEFIDHVEIKKSDVISISKDIESTVKNHKYLHYENYLTSNFRMLIEKWLRLALEFDPKLRGFEYVDKEKRTTFYSRLEEALELKCLTIFSLWNYEFYSLPITEETTLLDLYESLAKLTSLEIAEIDLILPTENSKSLVTASILDLYSLEHEPMLFVATSKMHDEKNKKLFISDFIKQVINNKDTKLKKISLLKKFARNILYLVRNEQNKFVTYLKGLEAYAVEVNHRLYQLIQLKNTNNMRAVEISNYTKVFKLLVDNSKDLLQNNGLAIAEKNFIQKWENECNNTKTNVDNIVGRATVLDTEYHKCLNKSTETAKSRILKEISEDHFDTYKIEEEIKCLMETSLESNSFLIEKYRDSFEKFLYDCTNKREILLSSSLESLHENINKYNDEYEKLNVHFNALSRDIKRQCLQIQSLLASHQSELFELNRNDTSISNSINQLSLSTFCLEPTEDVRQLIEENENTTLEISLLIEEISASNKLP